MTSTLYFAYGSNMLTARLTARCPSAKPVGIAKADAYDFRYAKKGMDASAKATLIENSQSEAYGVLFLVGAEDMAVLDRFEGRGRGYDRNDAFQVTDLQTGETRAACTYLANPAFMAENILPFDWYHALVLAGAIEHQLPGHYVASHLRSVTSTVFDRQSAGSIEAMQMLEKVSFFDSGRRS